MVQNMKASKGEREGDLVQGRREGDPVSDVYSANVKKRRSSRPILARLIEGPLPLPSGNRDLETRGGEKRSVLFHLQVNRIWIRAGLDYLT